MFTSSTKFKSIAGASIFIKINYIFVAPTTNYDFRIFFYDRRDIFELSSIHLHKFTISFIQHEFLCRENWFTGMPWTICNYIVSVNQICVIWLFIIDIPFRDFFQCLNHRSTPKRPAVNSNSPRSMLKNLSRMLNSKSTKFLS